jgi:hypothetical protein
MARDEGLTKTAQNLGPLFPSASLKKRTANSGDSVMENFLSLLRSTIHEGVIKQELF